EADGLEVHVGDGDEVVDTLLLLPVRQVRLVLEEVRVDVTGLEQFVGIDLTGDLDDVELVVAQRPGAHDLVEDLDVRGGRRRDPEGGAGPFGRRAGRETRSEGERGGRDDDTTQ